METEGKIDLLIRNGHILDPVGGIDQRGDMIIDRRRIVSITTASDKPCERELNACDCLVTPGLIDAHTHCNWLGSYIGIPADLSCIPAGVTATIDAGSAGVSNYRGLLRMLDGSLIRSKIMLHVSASGQIMSKQFNENINPDVWNFRLFEDAFGQYGNRIVGLKIRVSKDILGSYGLRPLRKALQLAASLGTRLFVHSTDPSVSMAELASMLRPGDVVCHVFHGKGETIIKNGRVDPGIIEARKRGVIFDVSQGRCNFSIEIAKRAIAEGFLPDSISTDLGMENWNDPLDFSLPMTMSKHLALGMTLRDIIRCVTSGAAAQFGWADELGTLVEGTLADVTVLKLIQHRILYRDIHGNSVEGEKMFLPLATVIDGQLLYRSPYAL
jgi:predicted amidohydrolase